jgi:hypothetical protein
MAGSMSANSFEQIDSKTWRAGFLQFMDMGKIAEGVTHRYEVTNLEGLTLGWVVWKSGWRRYTYKPVTGWDTWYDSSCLTSISDFVRLRTDERKAHWGPQGRFADRA